jgi:SET domain-containing protein
MNEEVKRRTADGGHPWIVFQESGIHGMGGYARVDLAEGMEIIEYLGERISKEESLRRCELNNPFIFGLDEEHDLDGNVDWNPARWLNHSCDPNCEALEDEGRIWITSRRAIAAGEELTFNYGYTLDDYREHPCQCGQPACVGYMVAEEFHPLVLRRHALRQEVAR